MKISMYRASLPVFVRMLHHLDAILVKAAAHAEVKKIDPVVLVEARLYPDMFPLVRQVQIATDTVKGCAARLAGRELPKYADNEASFPELAERIGKTIAFLECFEPAQIDGTEDKQIVLHMHRGDLNLDGLAYLNRFVIPNFYFHIITAYNILRHNGVEVGKMDFLGKE